MTISLHLFLICFFSCLNPLIYGFMSKNFRRSFVSTIRKCQNIEWGYLLLYFLLHYCIHFLRIIYVLNGLRFMWFIKSFLQNINLLLHFEVFAFVFQGSELECNFMNLAQQSLQPQRTRCSYFTDTRKEWKYSVKPVPI